MSKYSGIPEELREHLFLLRDQDATSHLLKVSGGLESVVMGRPDLAQVKNGLALGRRRRVRAAPQWSVQGGDHGGEARAPETSIASGAFRVVGGGGARADEAPGGNFDGCRVMIVGAGTMSACWSSIWCPSGAGDDHRQPPRRASRSCARISRRRTSSWR